MRRAWRGSVSRVTYPRSCRMQLRGNRWSDGSHPVRNEREVILGDGEESAAEREPPVAWILDEGELINQGSWFDTSAGVELDGEPPGLEVLAELGLVGLVAGDGGKGGELAHRYPAVQ